MSGKKYISKIVKGNDTIYVKDAEAQAVIQNVASAADCSAAAAEITFTAPAES